MMTITLLAIGFGVGTFLTSVVTLWTIGRASKPSTKAKEQTERTIELLAERNAIDERIENNLRIIANCATGWNMRP